MSDPTMPNEPGRSPDATPTEALQLPDQQPSAAMPPAAPSAGRDHTRTILEVIGGVVAVGLIMVAGAVGFLVGHATGSDPDEPWRLMHSDSGGGWHEGPDAYDGPDSDGRFDRSPGEGRERGRDDGRGPGPMMDEDGDRDGEWGPGPMMDQDDDSLESDQG
jgi:hypothetical protein